MKTIIATLAAVSLLVLGTMAFAHGTGGWGGGHMGPGYGNHMSEQGYGGHMMGRNSRSNDLQGDKEFLDKTADTRKSLHDKMFEYREAVRDPETTTKELAKFEKDIFELKTKIREKAPRSTYSGYGPCWDR